MPTKNTANKKYTTAPRQELFWDEPYQFEFKTTIRALPASNELILEQTAFYPGGGGQPPDEGVFFLPEEPQTTFRVTTVERREADIVHILDSAAPLERLAVGKPIIGQLNKERRLKLMQAHTSQHVFSAILKSVAAIETRKVHIDTASVTVFLEAAPSNEVLKRVLKETNTFLLTPKKVQTAFYPKNALPKELLSSLRGNLAKLSQPIVRVVSIETLGHSLCSGTHVANTSEIGLLFVTDVHGSVIHYFFGSPAMELLAQMNLDAITIAKALAAKPGENVRRLSSLLNEHASLKQQVIQLNKMLLAYQIPELKKKPLIVGSIKILSQNFAQCDRKFILQQLGPLPENTIALLIIKGPLLLVLSNIRAFPANEIIRWYCDRTKLKGGGSATIAQAAVTESEHALTLVRELLLAALKKKKD